MFALNILWENVRSCRIPNERQQLNREQNNTKQKNKHFLLRLTIAILNAK